MRSSILSVAAFLVVVGCGGSAASPPGRPSPSSSAARPSASASPAPSAPSASASASAAPVAPPLGWMDPLFDPNKALPLRAKIAVEGSVYFGESGLPVNSPSGSKTSLTTFVLEPPKPDATRVRLLCANSEVRTALYFDRKDLTKVAKRGALLVPAADQLARPPLPFTGPGLFFAAATPVDPQGAPSGGAIKVKVKAARLEVEGFVSEKLIDDVFEPEGAAPPVASNAELPTGAEFLDAPNGKRFARIAASPSKDNVQSVEKTTKAEKGFVVVRAMTAAGTLVGWVKESSVTAPRVTTVTSTDAGIGAGTARGMRMWPVAQGSKLLDHDTDTLVGVTLLATQLGCRTNCDGVGPPILVVDACGAKVEVVAKAPPPPKPPN